MFYKYKLMLRLFVLDQINCFLLDFTHSAGNTIALFLKNYLSRTKPIQQIEKTQQI